MQNNRFKIEWVQSLRGFAAIGVVLYHYLGVHDAIGSYSYLFSIGRYGVPLFLLSVV